MYIKLFLECLSIMKINLDLNFNINSQGSLVVWDVRTGEPVREVRLSHKDSCIFIKQMLALRDSVVCDYGRQLRIIRFPLVSDKLD